MGLIMVAIDEMLFCVKEGKSTRHRWRRYIKRLTFKIKCFFYNHLHVYRNGVVMGFWRIIFTIILPPLGVLIGKGFGWAFILNVILTLLGYFPGLIHAFWVQLRD